MELVIAEAARTFHDLVPIVVVLGVFQYLVIRRPLPQLRRILVGVAYVAVGVTLFRIGLSESLIPIGADMARQLSASGLADDAAPYRLLPVALLVFAATIGFAATLIEPTLTAAAERIRDLSGGALRPLALRVVVAAGVGAGLLLGTLRIVLEVPLPHLLVLVVGLLALLALRAPANLVPLALDSGGIATSVVTVPMITAYGLAVAGELPGRSPLADGFGLVVLSLLCPAIMVLAFAHIRIRFAKRST